MKQCGECQACCEGWLRAEIWGMEMSPGNPCYFLNKLEHGCGIYKDRPTVCSRFLCCFKDVDAADESFRPDKCGFILTKRQHKNSRIYVNVDLIRNCEYNDFVSKMNEFSDKTGYMYCVRQFDDRKLL